MSGATKTSAPRLAISRMTKAQMLAEAATIPGETINDKWSCEELKSLLREHRTNGVDKSDLAGVAKMTVEAIRALLKQEGVPFDSKDVKGKLMRRLRAAREATRGVSAGGGDKEKAVVTAAQSSTMEATSVLKRAADP